MAAQQKSRSPGSRFDILMEQGESSTVSEKQEPSTIMGKSTQWRRKNLGSEHKKNLKELLDVKAAESITERKSKEKVSKSVGPRRDVDATKEADGMVSSRQSRGQEDGTPNFVFGENIADPSLGPISHSQGPSRK